MNGKSTGHPNGQRAPVDRLEADAQREPGKCVRERGASSPRNWTSFE
ncbi:MAG: hypothetical protein IKO14_00975 [Oscillibacter sp.]|nr:hypothetical protein [Oscillibacter sp.]